MIKRENLREFVNRHGDVSIVDTQGKTHRLPSGNPEIDQLIATAEWFLWGGAWRSRQDMIDLISQSERGYVPGCAECERFERLLIAARERDGKEGNQDGKHELPALCAFEEHGLSHR